MKAEELGICRRLRMRITKLLVNVSLLTRDGNRHVLLLLTIRSQIFKPIRSFFGSCIYNIEKRLRVRTSQVTNQARAYLGFCCMK